MLWAAADVRRDIDRYFDWYGVDGIFLDEASTDCLKKAYYADLNSFVKKKRPSARTAINPGMATNECYVTAADLIVTFEGTYSTYVSSFRAAGWETKYAPSKFWHLVHATPTSTEMRSAVSLSKQRNAGWVYVTPDVLPNPWDTLTTGQYWTDELAAAQASR